MNGAKQNLQKTGLQDWYKCSENWFKVQMLVYKSKECWFTVQMQKKYKYLTNFGKGKVEKVNLQRVKPTVSKVSSVKYRKLV